MLTLLDLESAPCPEIPEPPNSLLLLTRALRASSYCLQQNGTLDGRPESVPERPPTWSVHCEVAPASPPSRSRARGLSGANARASAAMLTIVAADRDSRSGESVDSS